MQEQGFQASLDEIRRFLETWYFHISSSGHIYVRPIRQSITCGEVQAFLRRLDLLDRDCPPHAVLFDFRMTEIPPHRWRRISKLLESHARRAGSKSLVIFNTPPVGMATVIPRRMYWIAHQQGA